MVNFAFLKASCPKTDYRNTSNLLAMHQIYLLMPIVPLIGLGLGLGVIVEWIRQGYWFTMCPYFFSACNQITSISSFSSHPLLRWWVGGWQQCTATCGSDGVRKRTVLCVRTVSGEERVLHPVECKHLLKPKPIVPSIRAAPSLGTAGDTHCSLDICSIVYSTCVLHPLSFSNQ